MLQLCVTCILLFILCMGTLVPIFNDCSVRIPRVLQTAITAVCKMSQDIQNVLMNYVQKNEYTCSGVMFKNSFAPLAQICFRRRKNNTDDI